MKQLKYVLFCVVLSVTGFTGCNTIHEFAEEAPPTPDSVEVVIDINLNMAFDSEVIYGTYTRMLQSDYDIRYIVDVYNTDQLRADKLGTRNKRIVKTESSIITSGTYHIADKLKMPIGVYEIIVWIDFVEKGTATDKHYETTDLNKITVIPQNGKYVGYNATRDAFKGKFVMNLKPYERQSLIHYQAIVETKRPFAIYEIVTTDIKVYNTEQRALSASFIQPVTTNLYYNLFFPMGYNAYLSKPDNFKTGNHYTYNIMESATGHEAVLASDVVFIEDDTFYLVDFEIISLDGKRINGVSDLRINLKRNKRTIIRSEFLTKDIDPNNEVGVDDNFSEEIIIYI